MKKAGICIPALRFSRSVDYFFTRKNIAGALTGVV
jgi:hypothetical protein